jgi:hypothetical protein
LTTFSNDIFKVFHFGNGLHHGKRQIMPSIPDHILDAYIMMKHAYLGVFSIATTWYLMMVGTCDRGSHGKAESQRAEEPS